MMMNIGGTRLRRGSYAASWRPLAGCIVAPGRGFGRVWSVWMQHVDHDICVGRLGDLGHGSCTLVMPHALCWLGVHRVELVHEEEAHHSLQRQADVPRRVLRLRSAGFGCCD